MSTRIIVMLAAILVLVPFYIYFERKKPAARTIVMLTVIISLAVASRAAFFMVPYFKPVLAFAIIAGISMGANAGFITGSMTALVSNFFFGQGPWTIFQMVAWGLVGLVAGLIGEKILGGGKPLPMIIYGIIAAVIIHGTVTDIWTVFFVAEHPTLGSILAVYGAGLVPNLIFAGATGFFLLLFGAPMIKKINRIKIKYGLEEKQF